MKTYAPLILLLSIGFFSRQAAAQVGIGTTTPNPKAVLDLRSPGNNQGFLVPKLSTTQRNAIAGLSGQDNGLMVYDTDEQKFYFWQTSQWLPLRTGTDVALTAGTGISIAGNTISALDASPTNEIQDLKLVGGSLTITGNSSATDINLAPFMGSNTDEQTLAFNATSGLLSISNGNSVTITAAPTGTAGGILSGTYPNPTIANSAVTPGKIAPSTANGQVLTTVGGVTQWANPAPVQPTGAAGGDLTGSYPNPTIANSAVTPAKIAPSTAPGQVLTTVGSVTQWANPAPVQPIGVAGGDLTGSYPNPTIAPSKINGQVLTTVGGVTQWANPPTSSGAASLDAVLSAGNDAGGKSAVGFSAISINWPKDDPAGALNVNGSQFVNFLTINDNYEIKQNEYLIIGAATGKLINVRLPKASECMGRVLVIRTLSKSPDAPLVVQSSETIDGSTSSEAMFFIQGATYSLTFFSTGSEWLTINRAITPAPKG